MPLMKLDADATELYETAAAWFTRRQAAQEWSAQAEAELHEWLQADLRHRQAYQEIAEIWGAFDHVARPVLALEARSGGQNDLARGAADRKAKPGGWSRSFGCRRGFAVLALSICMLAGVGAWYWHDNTLQFNEHIQTVHGELREVKLPDDTVLTVNRNSRLDVLFYPRRREVVLAQGEAFFDVAPRHGDTFVIKVGSTQVRVVGTAFNVRTDSSALYVKVREGAVEVSSRGGGQDHTETLSAGEAVKVDVYTGVQQRLPSAPDVAGSWRSGQLIFRNAMLSEVVSELQGYVDGPIELAGRDIRYRRLSGFASTRNPRDFLLALPQLLPVQVQQMREGGYRILGR